MRTRTHTHTHASHPDRESRPAAPNQTDAAGICAGLARVGSTLLFATPMTTGMRADLGVFRSTDEASTWSAGALFSAGPAGYSDMTRLNDTHAAIIFENGENEFAQQINFAVIEA
jgi:hypothetical protein